MKGVARGKGKAEEGEEECSTDARGSIVEVGVGNGRRTASVVGNVDEARIVEIVVAVAEVDVGVGDSERTEVGDRVAPLCFVRRGWRVSPGMGSREPLARSPTLKRV